MNRKDRYKNEKQWRKTCIEQKQRYYSKTAFLYPSRRWTQEEDELILAHAVPDHKLSERIERSVAAIQHRRHMLLKKSKKD